MEPHFPRISGSVTLFDRPLRASNRHGFRPPFTNQKKIRLSKWYDKKTGFPLKTALFDQNSELISFSFYRNLIVDKPQLEKLELNSLKTISFKDVIKNHENLDMNQLEGIEELGTVVLTEVIKQDDQGERK